MRKPLSSPRLHRLFDSVAAQQGMDATDPIDHLRDAQVHHQTGERQGLPGRETVQFTHQLDHLDGCDRRRFVQSPAEAERQPAATGQARGKQRQAQLEMQLELHHHLHGAVERRPGDLPVALHRVSVTRREQRAIDRDRQEQRRAFR